MIRRKPRADDLALFDEMWGTATSLFDAVMQYSLTHHVSKHGAGIVVETYDVPDRDQRFDAIVPALMELGKIQITMEVSRTMQREHRLSLDGHIENMARAFLYHAEHTMLTDLGMYHSSPMNPSENMRPDDAPHHAAYRQLILALANHNAVNEYSAILRLSVASLILTMPNPADMVRILSTHMQYSTDYLTHYYTEPHIHILLAFHTATQNQPENAPWEWIAPLVFDDMAEYVRDPELWKTAKRLDRLTDRVRREQMRTPLPRQA